jgi:dienelactone hydrolase
MRKLVITAAGLVLLLATSAFGAVKTQEVRYTHNGTEFVGYLAYDDAIEGKRPGILVLHEWWGLNDYAKKRTEQLAEMGYVAFAADMYGKGQVTEHPQEAGAMATKVRENVQEWRARASAALDILKKQPQVDNSKLGAIGWCFGGSTALQLAFTGADLDAVVTFHAALPTPKENEAKAIKGELLINHGYADPFVTQATVQAFENALAGSSSNWTVVQYAGAKHSFTVKGIDSKGVEGLAYNARADHQSWFAMQRLFAEVFGPAK